MEQMVVHRAAERFRTRGDHVDTWHSFSFGHHYDSGNTSHGVLLVHDETVLGGGAGFDPHPHRDVEVVTWVVEGALVHDDSTGRHALAVPGTVQRISAGSGIVHSERNADPAPAGAPVRYVQMWVIGDGSDPVPRYEQRALDGGALAGALLPVCSGRPEHHAALGLGHRGATLHVGRLAADQGLTLPAAPWLHVFVALGSVAVEGVGGLSAGDAVRGRDTARRQVTAVAPAELLVWEMHADR